jgi:acyl-CoA thioester hydrolase
VPDAASSSSRTVELDLDIYPFDIDVVGHVSNITYIRWLEIGRVRLLEEVGLPMPVLAESAVVPIVIRTEIDYRRGLKLGEPVHLSLHLTEMHSMAATLKFKVTTGAETAAMARQRGLFVSTATGKPRRISEEIRARLEPYLHRAS